MEFSVHRTLIPTSRRLRLRWAACRSFLRRKSGRRSDRATEVKFALCPASADKSPGLWGETRAVYHRVASGMGGWGAPPGSGQSLGRRAVPSYPPINFSGQLTRSNRQLTSRTSALLHGPRSALTWRPTRCPTFRISSPDLAAHYAIREDQGSRDRGHRTIMLVG
jgi:hypothetical protein